MGAKSYHPSAVIVEGKEIGATGFRGVSLKRTSDRRSVVLYILRGVSCQGGHEGFRVQTKRKRGLEARRNVSKIAGRIRGIWGLLGGGRSRIS